MTVIRNYANLIKDIFVYNSKLLWLHYTHTHTKSNSNYRYGFSDWLNATPIHDKADKAEAQWNKLSNYDKTESAKATGNNWCGKGNLFDLPTVLRDEANTTSLRRKVASVVVGLPLAVGLGLGGIQAKNLASQSWQEGQNRQESSRVISEANAQAEALNILSQAKIKALREETQALKNNYDTLGVPEGARKAPTK